MPSLKPNVELRYDFLTPPRVVFGWGRRGEIGELSKAIGTRALIVWGSRTLAGGPIGGEIRDALNRAGVGLVELATIAHEPDVDDVDRVARETLRQEVRAGDFVLAIGGGSALDLGKAVAAMATNRASPTVCDYLEGVGKGLKLAEPPLPIIAMPTTAGTGSEATRNAVISGHEPPFKKSLRADGLMPRVALVDPEITVTLPPQITAWTGMDAVTQLIESYISRRARPIPRALSISGLRLAAPALPEAVRDGSSRPAREAMAHAALLSGMALANSGLGLAHGLAAALGASCGVAHGLACAVMLPTALAVNRASREQDFAEMAEAIGETRHTSVAARADAFVERIKCLAAEVGVPCRLSELGVRREHIPKLVKGSRGSSMDGNPREVSDDELADLLEAML